MTATTWTKEEDARLKELWVVKCNLKNHLHELGDRSYKQIMDHAKKTLKLGPRPFTARGLQPYAWAAIEKELKKGTGTSPELMARTGLCFSAVCVHLQRANPGPDGKVHIVGWEKRSRGGPPVAVYAIGPGENAEQPAPLTASEKWALKKLRKNSRNNPFATAISQVTNGEKITMSPKKGAYGSRVHYMEAA